MLFNIYIDDLVRKQKNMALRIIKIKHNRFINTILFADNQVIIEYSEDDL